MTTALTASLSVAAAPHVTPLSVMPVARPPNAAPTEATPAAPLASQVLLQGKTTLHIEHNGAVYRLQATRQGKLILTK